MSSLRQASLRKGADYLAMNNVAKTTKAGFNTAVRAYCAFAAHNWPEEWPWPATATKVEGFLVHSLRRGLTPKAARNYVTAIMWFMRSHDMPHTELKDHPKLQRMLAGAQRLCGTVETSAQPITKQLLRGAFEHYVMPFLRKARSEVPNLLARLEAQDPVALCNGSAVKFMNVWAAWTATLIGFCACLRLDNLLPSTLTRPTNESSYFRRGDMWFEDGNLMLRATRSKTNQFGSRTHTVVVAPVGGGMCAVEAMERHCRYSFGTSHGSRDLSSSLFRLRSTSGRPTTPLVHKQLVNHLKAMATSVGQSTNGISGHSLRRGGTTNCHRLGFANVTEHVAMLGDWTSRSVHLYHEIAPATRLLLPRAIAADMRLP